MKSERVDIFVMTQLSDTLSARGFPHARLLILRAGRHVAPARTERGGADGIAMLGDPSGDLFSGSPVPEPGFGVEAGREDPAAVGAEPRFAHQLLVKHWLAQGPASLGVP